MVFVWYLIWSLGLFFDRECCFDDDALCGHGVAPTWCLHSRATQYLIIAWLPLVVNLDSCRKRQVLQNVDDPTSYASKGEHLWLWTCILRGPLGFWEVFAGREMVKSVIRRAAALKPHQQSYHVPVDLL